MPVDEPTGEPGCRDRRRPLFARLYNVVSPRMEQGGFGALRDELLAGVRGHVVEVGAGNGSNFEHYPSGVTRVTAVEPEPYLRERARRAGHAADVPVEVVAGTAEDLPLPDASVDVGVVSLVLCSVDDPGRALDELARVIRPGGELRFLEHTVGETPRLRLVQRVLDATIWPCLTGGCHTGRDPIATIGAAGFRIRDVRRLRFPASRWSVPTSPHRLGVAERGDDPRPAAATVGPR